MRQEILQKVRIAGLSCFLLISFILVANGQGIQIVKDTLDQNTIDLLDELTEQDVWYNVVSIPPSPNASSLGKYGEYPVDKSTGVPSISIPIYDVKYGGITVPVSLSYHASGIKVSEDESWVGTGWSLNAGGVITRVMKGLPDEEDNGYLAQTYNILDELYVASHYAWTNCTLKDTLDQISQNYIDYEPDIFYYNFLNKSGSFHFNNWDTIYQYPDVKLKIDTLMVDQELCFKITDTDGTIYIFDQPEVTEGDAQRNIPNFISSWYLHSIENPSTGKRIEFTYSAQNGSFTVDLTQTAIYRAMNVSYIYEPISVNSPRYNITSIYDERYLNSIKFGNDSLVFNKSIAGTGEYELDTIILHRDNTSQHKFFLDYDVIESTPNCSSWKCKRLQLRSFTEIGENLKKIHDFEYDTQTLPSKDSYAIDHWGYYNGEIYNSGLIPEQSISGYTYFTADRDPHWPYTKAGILTKIIYPTGGHTEFEYESNKYSGTSLGGGVRIKTISSYDSISQIPVTKSYDYNSSGYLTLGFPVYCAQSTYIICSTSPPYSFPELLFYSSPVAGLGASGNSVAYSNVTEYNGTENSNTGKTETYYYYAYDGGSSEPYVYYPSVSNQWQRTLVTREVYSTNNGSGYSAILEKENNYVQTPTPAKTTIGFKVSHSNTNTSQSCTLPACGNDEYAYKNFYLNSFNLLVSNSSEVHYFPGGKTLQTYVFNTYDPEENHLHPIEVKTYNSTGDSIITRYKFASDIDTGIYSNMYDRNMLYNPISKSVSVNQDTITHYQWFYTYFPDNVSPNSAKILFNKAFEKTGDTDRKVIEYLDFDTCGNPLEVLSKDGLYTSFLWGYDKEYLIAEIKNAHSSNVYFTSFEDVQNVSVKSAEEAGIDYAKTGNKVWNSGTFSFTGWFEPASSSGLMMSYWYWSNNKWNFSGNIPFQNSISAGSKLDEIRVFPSHALMTTYTYDPLIGITSTTDLNNLTTYYEYDSVGRLTMIRDNNRNILSAFNYNYSKKE